MPRGERQRMNQPQSLAAYFAGWAALRPARVAVAAIVTALSAAAIEMAELVGQGALAGPLGRGTGKKGDVDEQKEIDLLANNRIVDVLSGAPVAAVASEEMDAPLLLDEKAPLLVAVDPLDGSSNIDANASIGMIFTVLPALQHNDDSIGLSAAGRQSARRRLLRLRSANGARRHRRRRHADLHARPPQLDVSAHASEGRDPDALQRVCDQRFQFAPLGRSDPHLRRGLPARQGRPARARLQHALDGLARCRHLPHRLARRHLPLPRRQAPRVPRRPAAAHLRGQPHRLGDRAGGRRGIDRSRAAAWR